MVTQTQLESFIEMSVSGRVCANQRIILDLLEQYPAGLSNNEISRILGWGINRVTPRVNEMEKKGRVFRGRVKVDVYTHKLNIVWVACVHRQLYKSMGFVEGERDVTGSPTFSSILPPGFPSTNYNQNRNRKEEAL